MPSSYFSLVAQEAIELFLSFRNNVVYAPTFLNIPVYFVRCLYFPDCQLLGCMEALDHSPFPIFLEASGASK